MKRTSRPLSRPARITCSPGWSPTKRTAEARPSRSVREPFRLSSPPPSRTDHSTLTPSTASDGPSLTRTTRKLDREVPTTACCPSPLKMAIRRSGGSGSSGPGSCRPPQPHTTRPTRMPTRWGGCGTQKNRAGRPARPLAVPHRRQPTSDCETGSGIRGRAVGGGTGRRASTRLVEELPGGKGRLMALEAGRERERPVAGRLTRCPPPRRADRCRPERTAGPRCP